MPNRTKLSWPLEETVFCHVTGDVIDHTKESRILLGKFSLRALLCALGDDIVVLPGMHTLPPELSLFNRLRIGPRPENVRSSFEGLSGALVRPFSGTSERLRALVREYDCDLDAPDLETCWRANDKGEFQKLCADVLDARLPFGVVCRPHEVEQAVHAFYMKNRVARVKATRSASGLTQAVFQPCSSVVLPNGATRKPTRYVVQEQLFCGKEAEAIDASVQFTIGRDRTITVGEATGQHIDADGHHFGNFFPANLAMPGKRCMSDCMQKNMHQAMGVSTAAIAHVLRDRLGYWGPGSIDFVGNGRTGAFYAVDPNCRVTAPYYAFEALTKWYGTPLPFDMRSFRVPHGIALTALVEHFEDVLFNREARHGFIPFCFLPEEGFCYGLSVAPTNEALLTLVEKVEGLKRTLLP